MNFKLLLHTSYSKTRMWNAIDVNEIFDVSKGFKKYIT